PLEVACGEARHPLDPEAGEGPPVVVPLPQDRRPGEPRLCPLEDEHLEQVPFVVRGHTPFVVVVGDVQRIVRRGPGAAGVRAQSGLQSRNGRGRSVATLPLLPEAVTERGEQRSSTTAVNVVVNVPAGVARTTWTRTASPTATRTVTRSAARKWMPCTASGCDDIVRSAGTGRPDARTA